MRRRARAGKGNQDMEKVKISFQHVSKVFKTRRQEIEALRDVSFNVYDHDFISIIGPSGCGKSTIIRILNDIIKPTSGEIGVDGYQYDLLKPVPREVVRKFGFVFQTPNLLPWLTVRDNILFPLKILRDHDPKWGHVADELLEMAGMSGYADAYPHTLSGGMLQRVGTLRAMAHQPGILLMDEPYGSLDEILRQQLDIETMNLWEKLNQTIVFITHNVTEAVFVSNRVYVMSTEPGCIIDEVKIDLPRPRTPDVTATKPFMAYVDQLTNRIGQIDLKRIK